MRVFLELLVVGISGAPGGEGISGAPGGEGISGAPGGEGISGSPGSTGLSGAPGGEGISGAPGSTGLSGAPGTEGISGAPGTSANPTYGFIYNMVFISGEISGLPPPPPPPQQTLSPATNPPNASQYVVFNSTGPHYGITFNGSNALTLLVTGDYLANYSASFVPNGGNAFSIKLIDNTVDVPGSVITSNSPVLNGSVEFSANAGDQISLANNMQNFATLVTQYSSSASPPVVTLVNSTVNASISGSPVTSLTTGPISYINPTSIYVGIQYHFGTTISVTVNDNHGGIYTQVPSSPSGGNALAIFYRDNVPPNQSVNVTVIFSGGTVDAVVELLQFTNTNTPSNSTSGVNNIGSSISPNVTINPTSTQQFMLLTAAVLEQTNVLTSGNVFLFEQDSVENIIDGGAGGANPIITGSQTINFNSSSIVTWLALGVLIDPAPTPSGGILSDPDNASLGITLLRQTT